MKKYNVAILGATGMVGQRLLTLLDDHPFFQVQVLAASFRSAGKKYGDLIKDRWAMSSSYEKYQNFIVLDAVNDCQQIARQVDLVFSAVDMDKNEIIALEQQYAKLECVVVSNNSPARQCADIPMVIPEINANHLAVINQQRKRLGCQKGFIVCKPNCSIQSYVPLVTPLLKYQVEKILVCTYQAISGAGKTFSSYPEIVDNIIPFIDGEEEKNSNEPLKIWGRINNGQIINNDIIQITSHCSRVPISDGHMAVVFIKFKNKPTIKEMIFDWNNFHSDIANLALPSAPKKLIYYLEDKNRPQPKIDRDIENGMAISIGAIKEDRQYDYKFVGLSHNTIRGAAGGAVLIAELLIKGGYL